MIFSLIGAFTFGNFVTDLRAFNFNFFLKSSIRARIYDFQGKEQDTDRERERERERERGRERKQAEAQLNLIRI